MSEQQTVAAGPWAGLVRRWEAATAADLLPRWAIAALVANVGIVLTGGLVRLTDSGLGCPTWPQCTADSYVPHPASGMHGVIEFGNRLLTFVLAAIMIMTFFTALRFRDKEKVADRGPRLRAAHIALLLALGIPAQGVVGGITVLTQLNPFVVGFHFLVSMGLIALSVWLLRRSRGLSGRPAAARWHRGITIATYPVLWMAIWLGTVVTGSGPHSGDLNAKRTGFDPSIITHVHAAAVYLLVGLILVAVIWFRSRAVLWLLAAVLFQGVIGVIQYNIGLPIGLVLMHLLGAALAMAAGTNYLLSCQKPVATSGDSVLTSR